MKYSSTPLYNIKDEENDEIVVSVTVDPNTGCICISDCNNHDPQIIYIPPEAAKLVTRAIIDVADNIHFAENSNFANE